MLGTIITAAAAAGCFLVAGFFLAFAATVMPALAPDARTGAEVMRAVNRWAVRPPFLSLFFGTAVLCAVAGVRGVLDADLLASGGAVAYLVALAVTVLGNVPLNATLARAADDDDAWSAFAGPWRRLNVVRALASALGGVLLLVHLLT